MNKPRAFHDNESENISGESELLRRGCGAYSRAVLINFFVPDAALVRGRRLIEGGAYLSKYGMLKPIERIKSRKKMRSIMDIFQHNTQQKTDNFIKLT